MQGLVYRKYCVAAIVVLFIGVSFVPSICGSIGELNSASLIEEVSDISSKLKKTNENDIAIYDESTVFGTRLFDADNSFGKTIYVDDDGGADYTRIQEAVDVASPGDTVFVYNGMYVENVIINKTLTLQGENKTSTIIDGNYTEDTILIKAGEVKVSGFTLQHAGDYHWFNDRVIDLRGDRCIIQDNIITDSKHSGIIVQSDENLIKNNQFSNLDWTMYVIESQRTVITNNTFNDADLACILGSLAIDCIISGNIIDNMVAVGIQLDHANGCQVYRNLINNTQIGICICDRASMNCVFENTIKNCSFFGMESAIDGPPGTRLPAWSIAFHNNFIDNKYPISNMGGTYWNAPYPAGGNFFDDCPEDGTDDYHGPNQNLSGSDGIYDSKYSSDQYPFVEQDGWTTMSIEPVLIALGGFDWDDDYYQLKPGETKQYRFYVMNAGNTGPVNWEIAEIPSYGSWEFSETNGSVTVEAGLVRVDFWVTAPDEQEKSYRGNIKVVNSDNPSNYWLLQSDLTTPLVHPFVQLLEKINRLFDELRDIYSFLTHDDGPSLHVFDFFRD